MLLARHREGQAEVAETVESVATEVNDVKTDDSGELEALKAKEEETLQKADGDLETAVTQEDLSKAKKSKGTGQAASVTKG